MRRTAVLFAGVVLGVLLAPAASAARCVVVLTCSEAEPATPSPTVAPPTTSTTVPQLSPADAAARLLMLLNGERAAAGLPPFTMRADVTAIAAGWTAAMAGAMHLSHNDAYFTTETRQRLDARLLGENVAYDGSIDAAHAALMASPPHRANILDGRFTVIGIAAERRDRTWWVTEDFVQPNATAPRSAPTPAPTPAAPAAPAKAAPVAAPVVTTETTAAGVEETAPEDAVLAATSEAVATAPPAVVTTSGPDTTTARPVPPAPVLVAVALLLAYALSWASASARIRCRWSPRLTSRG